MQNDQYKRAARDKNFEVEIDNRLACIEGHIKGVRQMIQNGKECEELLLQLSAIESAVHKIGKSVLKNHLEHCVKDGLANGEVDILDKFSKVLDKYI